MRTLLVACLLSASTLLASAQNDRFDKVQIKVQPVAGSVYMLEGAGGNIGVSVGEDGIVIVDDQFAPLAPKIKAALKGLSDKPVRFVINTHWHGDHVGGNAQFGTDSTIIAQENVRERMLVGSKPPMRDVKPAPKEALPIITFNDRASVHLNGEDIKAIHFAAGHTDGDSIIYFTKSNVIHMGDDFVTYGFPFVDLESGGSVQGMINAVEKVIATAPADAKVIPGHGPLSTVADMKPYVLMLHETRAKVAAGIKQGKTLDQLKQEKVLAGYEKWSGDFISTDKWIETIYHDLTDKKGEYVQHN
jgi:glyoxylase-like metal-dependent hydrolase (beta-lactamase superfamily II)